MKRRWGDKIRICCTALVMAAPVFASNAPDHGFEWVTITDLDNHVWPGSGSIPGEATDWHGAVNYTYRIAKTEVVGDQWIQFVRAYAPFVDSEFQASSQFTSSLIIYLGPGSNGTPQYSLNSGGDNLPVNVGWRFAARYCNWLHNDQASERWAFETGVYDTSTFGETEDNGFTYLTDQAHHDPAARYWIPTMDEWMKAVYWDPNKFGAGEGGWWTHPNGSDKPLVSGPPGIGETSAGTGALYEVGQYPTSATPFGILDSSGGRREWLEDLIGDSRRVKGSHVGSSEFWPLLDHISYVSTRPVWASAGIRLASSHFELISPATADVNEDGAVNGADLAAALTNWGPCEDANSCDGDLNGDAQVNGDDLIRILANWGVIVDQPDSQRL